MTNQWILEHSLFLAPLTKGWGPEQNSFLGPAMYIMYVLLVQEIVFRYLPSVRVFFRFSYFYHWNWSTYTVNVDVELRNFGGGAGKTWALQMYKSGHLQYQYRPFNDYARRSPDIVVLLQTFVLITTKAILQALNFVGPNPVCCTPSLVTFDATSHTWCGVTHLIILILDAKCVWSV